MALKTFNLPDPGEGLTEAEIVSWKVKPGDAVTVNDVVVEIETSKSLVELPIPWSGTVRALLVSEGDEVAVGAPIITIEVAGAKPETAAPAEPAAAAPAAVADASAAGGGEPQGRSPNLVGYGAISGSTTRRKRKAGGAAAAVIAEPAAPSPAPDSALSASAPSTAAPAASSNSGGAPVSRSGRPLAKPPVRKYAKDRGVDLAQVPGSGPDGIISREDIDAFLFGGGAGSEGDAHAMEPVATRSEAQTEREVRIPVKGVRKMTATAMSGSAFGAPHVSEFVTVDVSATMELLERLKTDREFRDVKVGPLLLVAKALLLACRRNPGVNASWVEEGDGATIVHKNYVNLGIAAATPRGLIVPHIKDAHALTLRELAQAMGELVDTARAGRTQPAELSGGTITITNVGVFGVDTGTPIINPGESAILAFGAIRRRPWVSERDGVESIEPRWVTQLGLSFDHRLIDGDLGSRFLADIAAILHDPAKGLVWG